MRVVVVGSGVGGASVACHLANEDGVDVVVVDAALPGSATEAGAGIVCPWTSRRSDPDEYRLAAAAAAYYPELAERVAGTSYEVVGGLVVSADEDELDAAHERLRDRPAGEVTRLTPREARALFPALAPELGAVHVAGAGRVDGHHLRRTLLDASGARLVAGRAELRTSGDRVTGVRVGDVVLDADAVVLAAGAWSTDLVAALGITLPLAPQRGQLSHFDLPGADTANWPVVLPVSSHYLLAFPGSRVVAGATRETGAGFDHRVTAAGQAEVLHNALSVAPGLADATLVETRVGFRPATQDGLPLLGAPAGHPELFVATGFGPAGLTMAPYSGRLIADLVLGRTPALDLHPYRPDRSST